MTLVFPLLKKYNEDMYDGGKDGGRTRTRECFSTNAYPAS